MILSFLVMTIYVSRYIGSATNPAWAVMLLGAIWYMFKNSVPLTLIHVLALLFLSYAALSLMWSPNGYEAFTELLALFSIFMIASKFKIESVIKGLALGLLVSDLVFIAQMYRLVDIFNATLLPAGLFINSNILAEVTALILVLLLINKMWWYLPIILPGLLVSSRASLMGLIGALIVWAWYKSKVVASGLTLIGLLAFYFMSAHIDVGTVSQRLVLWSDTIRGITLFGHGIGSFQYLYPLYSHLDLSQFRIEEVHNELLQYMFELGFIAVIPLIMMILVWNKEYAPWLICFVIISCFGFPLHIAATAFMFATVMGYLSRDCNIFSLQLSDIRPNLFKRMATA
jgi:hypothetical protein